MNAYERLCAARKSGRPIGVILMDQAAISGVGNIFRAESLYRQEIDPLRPGKSLSDDELKRLVEKRRSSGSTWERCSAPRAQASFA